MTTLHHSTSNQKQQSMSQGAPTLPGRQDERREPFVYLLHFDNPLGNERHTAIHYIGFSGNLDERIRAHRNGTSYAKIMTALYERKITFKVARTWKGGREQEKALKACKQYSRLCPICRMEKITRTMFPTPLAALYKTYADVENVLPM